jgi:hypothetical protein
MHPTSPVLCFSLLSFFLLFLYSCRIFKNPFFQKDRIKERHINTMMHYYLTSLKSLLSKKSKINLKKKYFSTKNLR